VPKEQPTCSSIDIVRAQRRGGSDGGPSQKPGIRRIVIRVATHLARDRCRERIQRLSQSGSDGESIQREAIAALQRVIGFDRWCLPLADPDTLLPGLGMGDHDYGSGLPRALELEYSGADFAAKHEVARRQRPASSMAAETGGDLARSPRWDEVLRPVGIGDIAAAACRDTFGCWGWIEAYRDASERPFSEEDLDLLAAVAPSLARVLRRSVAGARREWFYPLDQPGVLVLDRELSPVSRTEAATRWIAALPMSDLFASWGMLPAAIYPAATLARAGDAARAHATLAVDEGRWVRIEAALLDGDHDGDIAVTIRAAAPRETFGVACRAHGLTARETALMAALLAGVGTRDVAQAMHLSDWTVQDHLKSVFAKLAVHSRREALARLAGT
jgi:DNA-binding CsgD family transcriptional regulator